MGSTPVSDEVNVTVSSESGWSGSPMATAWPCVIAVPPCALYARNSVPPKLTVGPSACICVTRTGGVAEPAYGNGWAFSLTEAESQNARDGGPWKLVMVHRIQVGATWSMVQGIVVELPSSSMATVTV